MKTFFKIILLVMVTCVIGSPRALYSQAMYKINNSKDIDMKLSGTSTLHKWTMEARAFTGEAKFNFKPGNENQFTSITALDFSLVVKNLKSGEKGLDKNAYKALKTDLYKDIDYKLLSAVILPEKDNRSLVRTQGNLSIAGVTKEVTMDVYCLVNKDGSITCNGSYKLNMTDYKVKPPSFMLGAMKTGDAVTLDFVLVYKK